MPKLNLKKLNPFFIFRFSKWQIKVMLLFAALLIVISSVLFTEMIVNELIQREKNSVNFYADIYKRYSENYEYVEDWLFLLDKINPTMSFPIIATDSSDTPLEPFESFTLNVKIDTSKSIAERRKFLKNYINKMKKSYPPIVVEDEEGKVLNKFYYTNSSLVDNLKLFPLMEVIVVAMFVLVGYIAFRNIKRGEETRVWVGMSKEAAHQLGTPLSSLMAWLEILKNSKDDPDSVYSTAVEMENDVNRLNIIARRFSKIGSEPEKKEENLSELIENVCIYFEKRLPHIGRKINIVKNIEPNVFFRINHELMEWLIENILKNSAEAIENHQGNIHITLRSFMPKKIIIHIQDDGKGMTNKQKRQIFLPGYTTKKRGWGLGLSLCRRIVENYHNGKIYVKDTVPGKGTTFAIEFRYEN